MPILRFRIYWEDDQQIYRDIEIRPGQSFLELHKTILSAFEITSTLASSFYESNDRWQKKREISSSVLVNKKKAPALSMARTPVSALISRPDEKFIYVHDPEKQWTFLVELIGLTREEDPKKTYPNILRREGLTPAQLSQKDQGIHEQIVETEEKYDLGAEDMEGFGSEGDHFDDEGHESLQ